MTEERIAKYLARAGIASRRAVEALIEEGRVSVDGDVLDTPAFKVTGRELIKVDGRRVKPPLPARLFRYHKPPGLLTSNSDPSGRRTVFDELPGHLPRLVTVGRLDLNSEGLLLLTTDGELARALELPANAETRTYRVRAHGEVTPPKLERLAAGVVVDGERFAPILAELERETGANNWLVAKLSEGRNREVRRAFEAVGLTVNRLIRTGYGPLELGELNPGAVEEVPAREVARLRERLGVRSRGLGRNGKIGGQSRHRGPRNAETGGAKANVRRRRGK